MKTMRRKKLLRRGADAEETRVDVGGGGEGRLSFSFCWSFSPVFLEEERKDDPQVKCARKVLFSLRRACFRKVTKKFDF